MDVKTVWSYGDTNPENPNNFETIRQWWSGLAGREIYWQQRLIPKSGDPNELAWEPQRFDETFAIHNPEIRGITLYWRKSDSEGERNITVEKLILDRLNQELFVYSRSQKQLVLRVKPAEVTYRAIELNYPEIVVENHNILVLRDAEQLLEVRISLNPEQRINLRERLS